MRHTISRKSPDRQSSRNGVLESEYAGLRECYRFRLPFVITLAGEMQYFSFLLSRRSGEWRGGYPRPVIRKPR